MKSCACGWATTACKRYRAKDDHRASALTTMKTTTTTEQRHGILADRITCTQLFFCCCCCCRRWLFFLFLFSWLNSRAAQFLPNELVLNGKSPSDSSQHWAEHTHTSFGRFDMLTSPVMKNEDAGLLSCKCHCATRYPQRQWITVGNFLIDKWWWWSCWWKCVPSSRISADLRNIHFATWRLTDPI